MTVLGRGLVFQPVLVTQTCTYNSKYITLTLQIFHQKRREKKTKQNKNSLFFKMNITTPPPLPPSPKKTKTNKTHNNSNKRGHHTSKCFDMSLKLDKLQVKNDKGHNQMTNIIEST